jgi:VanZ family protein
MNATGMMERMKPYEFQIAGLLVLAESFILLFSSFQTGAAVDSVSFLYFNSATLGHFLAYLLYGGLLARVFRGNSYAVLLALVIGASFGFLNEGIQSFVPGRDMSAVDVLVNTAGSAIGGWLSLRISRD